MSIGLPHMVYADGIRKHEQTQFGGYNHTLSAKDGELWDMTNMSSDHYPLLSPRKPRYLYKTVGGANLGLYADDGLYYANNGWIWCDERTITSLSQQDDLRVRFVSIGTYVAYWLDGRFFDAWVYNKADGKKSPLWARATLMDAKIQDGTYAGEAAEANTIYVPGAGWDGYFREGDAVTISGAKIHPENNQTIIIREIDGDYLRFYENSFVINSGGDKEMLTITRDVPDLDFVCENENRLWGCKGDTIYACKLGDPFNWNVFDGISTDSYAVDVGSAGDFTACISYLGYPVFFKEDKIYKVYGDRPSNFQVMSSASLGVAKGSDRSLAIAGEVLFYLSRVGIMAYSGGIPQSAAAAFGNDKYKNAVGGSDGIKYFVSMENERGEHPLFVFDTRHSVWHKYDDLQVLDFAWLDGLYFLDANGNIWLDGDAQRVPERATTEESVRSTVEWADIVENDPNKKGSTKLQLRVELDAGTMMTVSMQFDSDGVWRDVASLTATRKRSYYLPIIPRRSDHFKIRIEATGSYRIYSLVRESYSGSEMRSLKGE